MENNKQVSSHTPLFYPIGEAAVKYSENENASNSWIAYNGFVAGAEFQKEKLQAENEKLKADKAVLLEALKNAIKFIKCTPKLGHDEDRPKGLERWEQLIELNK